jgi:hypothetical protein
MDTDLIVEKYELVKSKEYQRIRQLQLELILQNRNIEPLELRGMLKLIAKTDEWENEFLKFKERKG